MSEIDKPYTLPPGLDPIDDALRELVGLVELIAIERGDERLWDLVNALADARREWAFKYDTTPDTEEE